MTGGTTLDRLTDWAVGFAPFEEVKAAFAREGVRGPVPQREIRLVGPAST